MIILPFNEDNLAEALSNSYTPTTVIRAKSHYKYFCEYLGAEGLKAQSIVIEEHYVNKDFLQDYAEYYAFCFKPYPKYCRRVHFFNTTISEYLLNEAILNKLENANDFWNNNYLGFIVIKPIPTTVIGYTILKDYNFANNVVDREFWGLRLYNVHVFGKKIQFPSLAFQEQDTVISACATTAIWIMLNRAATDFSTVLKSPNQITKDAGNISPDGSRLFPNKGLSVQQICNAVFSSGLVSEVKQPNFIKRDNDDKIIGVYVSNLYIKKIINAYSPIGIPVILVIKVPDGGRHGLHAITVLGHRQPPVAAIEPKTMVSWRAESIERIYAHDDQWGPFIRINFNDNCDLITPWTDHHADKLPTYVTNIIVPVYPKVRISYEDIEAIVHGLDGMLTLFFDKKLKNDLVWDIEIDFSQSFKENIRQSVLDDNFKLSILEESLPKYLWIATCYIGTRKAFEFTFDATDVNNAMIGKHVICYLAEDIKQILLEFLKTNKTILSYISTIRPKLRYYDFLLEKLA